MKIPKVSYHKCVLDRQSKVFDGLDAIDRGLPFRSFFLAL